MSQFRPTSPTVSVLMAVRNAEKTVRRAVESLQNQTLRNFELLVVDCGSSDGTARILDSLAERDMRLAVMRTECDRQEALNLALSRAAGEYVLVADADGWAEPPMLSDLVSVARESALELAVGGMALSVSFEQGRPTEFEATADSHVFVTQHDFRAAAWKLFSTGQLLPASAKLFSLAEVREHDVRFDETMGTDHSFVLGFLRDVERVGVVGGVSYHVARVLPADVWSLVSSQGYQHLESEQGALLDLYRHWGLEGDVASMEMLQSRYLERLVGCVEGVCGWRSPVPSGEQRALVAKMIGSKRAQLAASVAHPRGSSAKAMLAPIRSGNVALTCVQARLISLLRWGSVDGVVPDAFV